MATKIIENQRKRPWSNDKLVWYGWHSVQLSRYILYSFKIIAGNYERPQNQDGNLIVLILKSMKQEAGSLKKEAWKQKSKQSEAGSRKQEAGSRKQEARSRKQEAGSKKQEGRRRKEEAGSRETGSKKQEARNLHSILRAGIGPSIAPLSGLAYLTSISFLYCIWEQGWAPALHLILIACQKLGMYRTWPSSKQVVALGTREWWALSVTLPSSNIGESPSITQTKPNQTLTLGRCCPGLLIGSHDR